MPAVKTPRREFLQLAKTYDPAKNDVAGWYISEKLDGTRCLWDGGISRGIATADVPYASVIDPKTGRRKSKIKPVATGLWSRYGNPIMAPDWFLDSLPKIPLDGELWAGEGNFQLCRSICAGDDPDPRFNQIRYAVYSAPRLDDLFQDGEIKNANMRCDLNSDSRLWVFEQYNRRPLLPSLANTFDGELAFLNLHVRESDNLFVLPQTKLPTNSDAARHAIDSFMEGVLDRGGEGVVLRDPEATWTPKRNGGILKYKPFDDAEATIVGFVAGKEGKQGNVLGKIGAILCRTKGPKGEVEFEIGTGMTMEEREFESPAMGEEHATEWARANPGGLTTRKIHNGKHFKIGQTITFKYREWTDDGIPKEGRYFRPRDEE